MTSAFTAKQEKILSMSRTKCGAPLGLYDKEAKELRADGLIRLGEKYSAVGARSLRWFATEGA